MTVLQYKIIEIEPNSIQVLYYEKDESDGIFLNVGTTPFPQTEAELIERIQQNAPHGYFEQKKMPTTNMSHLIGRTGVTGVPTPQINPGPGDTSRIITFEDS